MQKLLYNSYFIVRDIQVVNEKDFFQFWVFFSICSSETNFLYFNCNFAKNAQH